MSTAPKPLPELVAALRARTIYTLPANWQAGLKCPECDASADRPKCMFELGAGCPRHDPENYTPDPRVQRREPVATQAADAIESLATALRQLIAVCDAGVHFEAGAGGMSLEAQLARTLINRVPAAEVEKARQKLMELEYPELATGPGPR